MEGSNGNIETEKGNAEIENTMVPLPPVIARIIGEKEIQLTMLREEVAALRGLLAERDAAIESLRAAQGGEPVEVKDG